MRYELTLYDTEAREDRVREYTQSRRRAAVWALMPRRKLSGSFHHLVFRVREYSTGPKRPTIPLRQNYRDLDQALGELHQRVREAKALPLAQLEMLEQLREAGEESARFVGANARKTMQRLQSKGLLATASAFPEAAIGEKGLELLRLRLLP